MERRTLPGRSCHKVPMGITSISRQWREAEEDTSVWILRLKLSETPVVKSRTVTLACPPTESCHWKLLSSPLRAVEAVVGILSSLGLDFPLARG